MVLDQSTNFARTGVTALVEAGDTTIAVVDASVFDDPTNGSFNAVLWDSLIGRPDEDGDVEVVRVTDYDTTNDTITVTRGQESTTDTSHPDSSAVMATPTAKMFGDIDTELQSLDQHTTVTKSGDGSTTTFTLTHNFGTASVNVYPTSRDASPDFWYTNFTTSDVTIEYATAPENTTDNLTYLLTT